MMKFPSPTMIGVIVGLSIASPALAKQDDGLTATVGADFSRGTYGGETDTDILVAPVNLRYRTGNLRLSATLPWLRITGSSAVIADGRGGFVIDPNAPRTSRSGFGDLTIGAAYSIPESRFGLGLEFGGRIKVPTASRGKALGTGKADYAVSAEVTKTFGTLTPFVNVGYRMPGNPNGVDLRNSWMASAGTSLVLGKSVVIAAYDYRQASSRLAQDGHELFGAFSTPLSSRMTLTVYGTGGLSEGAAAYGIGSALSIKL